MSKVRVYLRVAKGQRPVDNPYAIDAGSSPRHSPLLDSTGRAKPTAAFAVDLNIPDELFERAEQVLAEGDIPLDGSSVFQMVPVSTP